MRGAQILPQGGQKALLRETCKFFNKFSADHGHISTHGHQQEEEEEEEDNSANFDDTKVSQVLDGDDDYSDESTLQQDSIETNMYWKSQEALLQEILDHYSSSGSKLREEIKRLIEIARETNFCDCKGPKLDGCASCLRSRVINLLCTKGFHANLCTSMWKRTQKIPGGRHEYIELNARSQGKKRKIKFLIEIEFRDEFKMAKASVDYKKLIELLPETYMGKPEHLNAIVRIMCDAAKRSTAEKKIHMGPWRKKSFMRMKWSASHVDERSAYQSSSQIGLVSSEQNDIDRVLPLTVSTAVRVAEVLSQRFCRF